MLSAAFPQLRRALQSLRRREGMAPASLALARDHAPVCMLAVPLSRTLSQLPSLQKKRAFGKLDLLTGLIYILIPCGVVGHLWGGGKSWERPW